MTLYHQGYAIDSREPAKRVKGHRVCKDCSTILSSYNTRLWCSLHEREHPLPPAYGSPDEERPSSMAPGVVHGFRSRYVMGCRCDLCCDANNAYEGARQKRRAQR